MSVECPGCGHVSDVEYRCEKCGRDLADVKTTGGERAVTGGTSR